MTGSNARDDTALMRIRRRQRTIWLVCVLALVVLSTNFAVAAMVSYAASGGPALSREQRRWVTTFAQFPWTARAVLAELYWSFRDDPGLMLLHRTSVERPDWTRRFPAREDPGYLLFSGVDAGQRGANVKLIRIADGATLVRWTPDWKDIVARTSQKPDRRVLNPRKLMAVHPLILPGGDIVFNTGESMVRQSPCRSRAQWVLDQSINHSNELAADGSIWTISVSGESMGGHSFLNGRMRNDSIARVSPDGRLLQNLSFYNILVRNGLEMLVLGTSGLVFRPDPIHLNEVLPAPTTTRYWRKGDLLISARHLSALFLYRPSTDKILWYRLGPWLNQHSPEFIDDHRISVFDNHVILPAQREARAMNRVMIYDFSTGKIAEPFEFMLAKTRPVTISGGRARVLPDGGLFLEETNSGRHLRFTKDRLLWSRVNDYNRDRIGLVEWSRYLTPEEAKQPLADLAARRCSRS